jgi:hypothetical protein
LKKENIIKPKTDFKNHTLTVVENPVRGLKRNKNEL